MKKLSFLSIMLLSIAAIIVGCQHSPVEKNAEGPLRIGADEVDITPPVGFRMAGYFDDRRATGMHDPLKAKAIVMDQNGERIALVFCDLVGVSLNVTRPARAQASQATGIPVSHIVISCTHSHTGPLFDDVREHYGTVPKLPFDYPGALISNLVQVITRANANLRPAELSAGLTKAEGLTFNRRYWMKNGKVAFNPGQLNPNIVRPAGPTDPTVGILLARDAQTHQPFAGATVFAMHADTVGTTEFSADYPFYLQQTLRSAFGPDFISAFGAGTCGDLNHINVNKKEDYRGYAVAERLGTAIGKAVLDAVPELQPIQKPSLAVASKTFEANLQKVTPEEVADARSKMSQLGDEKADFFMKVVAVKRLDLAWKGRTRPMEVQVFRFDSQTALVCLPCEIFIELGQAIRRASPFPRTMVMSICNDRPSYVPTLKAFSEGSYEVTNSRVAPGTGERLVATANELLQQLHEH
jgi:neutral ceramidase